jgi:hypothetical protein
MGNMSYCRFENTFRDLQDCYDALREKDFSELSETEKKFRNYMVEMCKDIADEFEVEEITEDEEA